MNTVMFSKYGTTLLITIILMLISISAHFFDDYSLNTKHYLGFTLTLVSALFYYVHKKAFAFIFIITLVLGFFKLIDIFFLNLTLGMGSFKFNPLFVFLLILFISLSKEEFNKMFPEKQKS